MSFGRNVTQATFERVESGGKSGKPDCSGTLAPMNCCSSRRGAVESLVNHLSNFRGYTMRHAPEAQLAGAPPKIQALCDKWIWRAPMMLAHVCPGAIPEELTRLTRWVNWEYRQRKGKRTKVPLDPRTGAAASCDHPGTWGGFQQALD